jgi:hypothetical protein
MLTASATALQTSSRLTPTLGAASLAASLCRIGWGLGRASETAATGAAVVIAVHYDLDLALHVAILKYRDTLC